MTQTVILTQPVRFGGSVLDAGTTQALADDIAADLVARGFATSVGTPVWQSSAKADTNIIAQSSVPFVIMPGDGGANGCSFSGAAGAFTLSAAIISNAGTVLAGCYAYFSANFGGSTLPAGWYWTEFSSDTAGTVYANTYTSGTPRRPPTNTPITVNLTGRITATTNEVTGPNAFLLPANSLGKNGTLEVYLRNIGSTAGTKTYRLRGMDASTTQLVVGGASASPVAESLSYVTCANSHTTKFTGRLASSGNPGVGEGTSTLVFGYVVTTFDTAVDQRLSFTLQQSTNVATPILASAIVKSQYGD